MFVYVRFYVPVLIISIILIVILIIIFVIIKRRVSVLHFLITKVRNQTVKLPQARKYQGKYDPAEEAQKVWGFYCLPLSAINAL